MVVDPNNHAPIIVALPIRKLACRWVFLPILRSCIRKPGARKPLSFDHHRILQIVDNLRSSRRGQFPVGPKFNSCAKRCVVRVSLDSDKRVTRLDKVPEYLSYAEDRLIAFWTQRCLSRRKKQITPESKFDAGVRHHDIDLTPERCVLFDR